jgi:hypothetical protein
MAGGASCASVTEKVRRTNSLAVNLVVLWNTIYMDAALNQLMSEGYEVRPEDVARLSPLRLKHINMLGRYAFTLPSSLMSAGRSF